MERPLALAESGKDLTKQYEVFLDLDVSLIIGFAPQEQVLNESEFEGSLENLP